MKKAEMVSVMLFLAKAYDSFRHNEDKIEAWYSLFENYDGSVFLEAAKTCAKKSKYAPTPADLEGAYWRLVNERQENIAEGLRREAQEKAKKGDVCKWCGGTGYFKVQEMDGGQMFEPVAPCSCGGDASYLNRFLNNAKYVWSDKKRMFVFRESWIGDEGKQQAMPLKAMGFADLVKSF